jgi:hypothetical protein
MARTQPRIYTHLMSRPYKHAIRYYDTERMRTIVEVQSHYALPDLIEGLLVDLKGWQPDILEKVSAVDDTRFMSSPHKSRRYISRDRETLYIASPHLTEKFSRPVDDHWIITNMGRQETYALLSAIVSASGLKRESLTELKL